MNILTLINYRLAQLDHLLEEECLASDEYIGSCQDIYKFALEYLKENNEKPDDISIED